MKMMKNVDSLLLIFWILLDTDLNSNVTLRNRKMKNLETFVLLQEQN